MIRFLIIFWACALGGCTTLDRSLDWYEAHTHPLPCVYGGCSEEQSLAEDRAKLSVDINLGSHGDRWHRVTVDK